MLWRYAGVAAGMRMDSERRFRAGRPGRRRKGADLARAYLRFYGPAEVKGFAAWAGLAPAQGRRLWDEIADELVEVEWKGGRGWIAEGDRRALDSPPQASGTRLIPPRDPYLQQADRETLVPDAAVRKRLFRAVASPGAVLRDGALAGMWKAKVAAATAPRSRSSASRRSTATSSSASARGVAKLRGADGFDARGVTRGCGCASWGWPAGCLGPGVEIERRKSTPKSPRPPIGGPGTRTAAMHRRQSTIDCHRTPIGGRRRTVAIH